MVDEKDYYFNEIFEEYKRLGEIQGFGKKLGNGSFGIVKEVIYKNKQFAGKLTIKDSIAERELSEDLKGSNIIKFYKVCNPISKYGNTYHLIIMEKAILKDLGKLNQYFHEHNLLKLIFRNCFNNEVSDSLLRYYSSHYRNIFLFFRSCLLLGHGIIRKLFAISKFLQYHRLLRLGLSLCLL